MKPRRSNQRNQALTLVEVLVIIGVVIFLGVCLLSVLSAAHKHSKNINCVKNLHEIGTAYRLCAGDNNQFPLLSAADDRSGGPARNYSAYVFWQAMSNDLNTPKILVCPADRKRTAATDFGTGFGNSNISYFLNAAAKTDPQTVLDGDANLSVDGIPVKSGILNVWTNSRIGWTKERNHGLGYSVGNIGMADGGVLLATSNSLNSVFAASPVTNRLAIP